MKTIRCLLLCVAVGSTAHATDSAFSTPNQQLATPTPNALVIPSAPAGVAFGYQFGCITFKDGSAKCWGENKFGQLGLGHAPKDNSYEFVTSPTKVALPRGASIAQLALNDDSACALFSDKIIRCWGNVYGIPSDGTVVAHPTLKDINDPVEIVGAHKTYCVRRASGAVRCLGSTEGGSLSWDPKTIAVTNVKGISPGDRHSCVVHDDKAVSCWGSNVDGQLGIEMKDYQDSQKNHPPKKVPGIANIKAVAAGTKHTCALRTNGTVICWGASEYNQAGDKPDYTWNCANGYPCKTAFREIGITDVEQIATSYSNTCARLKNGSVRCWGGSGNWGVGKNGPHGMAPSSVLGISSASVVSGGDVDGFCSVGSAQVWCWGASKLYAYANGGGPQALSPIKLPF